MWRPDSPALRADCESLFSHGHLMLLEAEGFECLFCCLARVMGDRYSAEADLLKMDGCSMLQSLSLDASFMVYIHNGPGRQYPPSVGCGIFEVEEGDGGRRCQSPTSPGSTSLDQLGSSASSLDSVWASPSSRSRAVVMF